MNLDTCINNLTLFNDRNKNAWCLNFLSLNTQYSTPFPGTTQFNTIHSERGWLGRKVVLLGEFFASFVTNRYKKANEMNATDVIGAFRNTLTQIEQNLKDIKALVETSKGNDEHAQKVKKFLQQLITFAKIMEKFNSLSLIGKVKHAISSAIYTRTGWRPLGLRSAVQQLTFTSTGWVPLDPLMANQHGQARNEFTKVRLIAIQVMKDMQ